MPLPWIRLDTAMPDHPKILDLVDGNRDGRAAAFVWVCSLAYAGKHGTEGFIPKGALSRCNGRPADAKLLVAHRLWDDLAPKGWLIHGWEEYQTLALSLEELEKRGSKGGLARAANMSKEDRSEAASKAAQARWNGGGNAY